MTTTTVLLNPGGLPSETEKDVKLNVLAYPTLTLEELYNRNNVIDYSFRIYVKFKNTNGTYTDWSDVNNFVTQPVNMDDTIQKISYSLANDSYSFGQVKVPNCKLKLLSSEGEFGIETNQGSIFYGYKRHESMIKVTTIMTDPFTKQEIETELYRGFINENSANTKVDKDNLYQYLQIEDVLNYLIKKYTFIDISPTETVLNDLIFQIMNRSEFTDFMTVDALNIDAGFNTTQIAYTDGDGKPSWDNQEGIIELMQGLSTGHSFFYQKEGVFYYQPISASGKDAPVFDKDKIIGFKNFDRGVDKVFELLYWQDTAGYWAASVITYNRTKTFDIRGIYNVTVQNALLGHIGARVSVEKEGYKVSVPLYPDIYLLDRIRVNQTGYFTEDAAIWGRDRWGEAQFKRPVGASTIGESDFWIIIKIVHDCKNCKTEFVVQSII